jgi:hypothetical protein
LCYNFEQVVFCLHYKLGGYQMGIWVLTIVSGLFAGLGGLIWGVSPIIAAILIGVCFFQTRYVLWMSVFAMLFRDLFMGIDPMTLIRILAVLGAVGTVHLLKVKFRIVPLLIGLLAVTPVFHFLISVGSWAVGACGDFPKTFEGLTQSIVTAVPYFLYSLTSQIFFTFTFVGAYSLAGYLMTQRWPAFSNGGKTL